MLPFLMIIFVAGCGDPTVTGKVTFPDGTPLTQGQVMFQKDGFVASGNLQQDGTYSVGKLKDGDGLPPGRYQVFITGATTFNIPGGASSPSMTTRPIILVDSKYLAPNTSDLTVEVSGKTTFDITVEPPKQ